MEPQGKLVLSRDVLGGTHLDLQSTQTSGPISQNEKKRHARVHYFGHLGGPGSSKRIEVRERSFVGRERL